jgi:hypothetical protein
VLLVPRDGQLQVARGDPAAVAGLEPILHGARAEPSAEDADHLEHRHAQHRRGRAAEGAGADPTLVERRHDHVPDDGADDVGAGDGHQAEQAAAGDGEGEDPRLVPNRPAQHS